MGTACSPANPEPLGARRLTSQIAAPCCEEAPHWARLGSPRRPGAPAAPGPPRPARALPMCLPAHHPVGKALAASQRPAVLHPFDAEDWDMCISGGQGV